MKWLKRKITSRKDAARGNRTIEQLCFEKLEPRILLSADAIGGAIDNHDHALFGDAHDYSGDAFRAALEQQLSSQPHLQAGQTLPSAAGSIVVEPADWTGLEQLYADNSEVATRLELVVVDASVPDYQQLVDSITNDTSVHYQVLLLDGTDDPLRAIGAELAQLQRVDAVHLVGHGETGTLALGGLLLNSETIDQYQHSLVHWRAALSPDADILVYGCDIAASPAGEDLLNRLAAITGADIAASEDITGGAHHADWDLEFRSGQVETSLAFGLDVQQSWQHSLLLVIVDSSGDSVNASDGVVTLREAINAVNEDALANPNDTHVINFNLAAGTTISLTESLPDVYAPVTIDASSAANADGDPGITLTGGSNGLVLRGDGITIDGLKVDGMTGHGLLVFGSNNVIVASHIINSGASGIHASGSGNTIAGNTITGNAHHGIYISGANNTIGGADGTSGNVVSDNGMSGIMIDTMSALNNTVQGNYIGLTPDGLGALGNTRHGVEVTNGAASTLIGGSTAGAGNVISANGLDGISISFTDGAPGVSTIAGNIIGLDASGSVELGNAQHGIFFIDSPGNIIGGVGEHERNIISANGGDGIRMVTDSYGAVIANNYIGTDITGSQARGNTGFGIHIDGASDWVDKAGTALGVQEGGNIISGNGLAGVYLASGAYNVSIAYNSIGVGADGTSRLGNKGDGITVETGIQSQYSFTASNVDIHHNRIAYNSGAGVSVENAYTHAVWITENLIHSNLGIGIDLAGDGVTPNDPYSYYGPDNDYGENTLADHPTINRVEVVDGEVRISGALTHNAPENTLITIHFYYTDAAHSTGNGEAKHYIGSTSLTATSYRSPSFAASFLVDIPAGSFITATATGVLGTSELAPGYEFAEGHYIDYEPTGVVEISGTLVQGALLVASNTLADANGIASPITYQWRRDGVPIEGAEGAEYELTQEDVEARISVEASFVDGNGNIETVSSTVTDGIANGSFDPTGAPTIFGDLVEYASLTADIGTLADGDNIDGGISYQWLRNGVEIAGADLQSYGLTSDDVGAYISVRATYQDGDGTLHSVDSALYGPVANVNDAPTGEVGITGIAAEYQLLAAQTETLVDADGLPTDLNYQWYRNGEPIAGATASTYELASTDIGARISVAVSYVDGGGKLETVLSSETAVIANTNDSPTGEVTIDGSAAEYATLTASHTLADRDGLPAQVSYQWYRSGNAIAGADAQSYALQSADIGAAISVTVSYTDAGGTYESVSSAATVPVTNTNDAPTGELIITGEPKQYSQLFAAHTIDDHDGMPDQVSYQWLRDGVAISGATVDIYTLTQEDVGREIRVRMQYLDGAGTSETITSAGLAPIENVNDSPTGTVTISGRAAEHETLTAISQLEDLDGLAGQLNYQWLRDGVVVSGATSQSYTLSAEDIGAGISVQVTYVDGDGFVEAVQSEPAGPVSNTNDAPQGVVIITGAAAEFETLRASHNLSDADGHSAPVAYQWYRDGVAIAGALGETYILIDADIGTHISVRAAYVDDFGTREEVWSSPTAAVLNTNSAPAGQLVISGAAVEGSTLSVINSLSDQDGTSGNFSYQWLRNGQVISGAAAPTYTLAQDDIGAEIQVRVSYRDAQGTDEQVTSDAVGPVAEVNLPPVGAVTISGAAKEYQTLTAALDVTDGNGIASEFFFQWYRDGVSIAEATSDSYTLGTGDIGAQITVEVSYQDKLGSRESLISEATNTVTATNNVPSGAVIVAGVAQPGAVLRVSHTISDVDTVAGDIQFQWQRDGEPISGATGLSYQLTDEDSGCTISVIATYTDGKGFEEVVLSQLMEVAAPQSALAQHPIALEKLDPVVVEEITSPERAAPAEGEPVVTQQPVSEYIRVPINYLRDADSQAREGLLAHADQQALNFFLPSSAQTDNDLRMNAASVTYLSASEAALGTSLGSIFPSLADSLAILNEKGFSNSISKSLNEVSDDSITLTAAVVGGSAALSAGLSVGYLVWTLRSGILITSLLSSMPAWRFIDPLPILSGRLSENDDEDDESLESLVADESAEEPTPAETE